MSKYIIFKGNIKHHDTCFIRDSLVVYKITWYKKLQQRLGCRAGRCYINICVHASFVLPVNSCTLYLNIVIQCEEKNIVIQHMLYAGKMCILSNEISHFLLLCQDIWPIINYYVTCQFNMQVKYIVQRYYFPGKHKTSWHLLYTWLSVIDKITW